MCIFFILRFSLSHVADERCAHPGWMVCSRFVQDECCASFVFFALCGQCASFSIDGWGASSRTNSAHIPYKDVLCFGFSSGTNGVHRSDEQRSHSLSWMNGGCFVLDESRASSRMAGARVFCPMY